MKTYYERPTQVMFIDEEGIEQFGIAYLDEIICGCCGGIFSVEEVIDNAPDHIGKPIYEYPEWSNLADEIYGGVYPEEYEDDVFYDEEEDEDEEE